MEQSLIDFEGLAELDLRTLSPLTLAFLGDAVFELLARSQIVGQGNRPPGKLHGFSAHIVCATSQARFYQAIEGMLSEEEQNVFRRGKNVNSQTRSKHASLADYRVATGLEALFGWLFLRKENRRMMELWNRGVQAVLSETGKEEKAVLRGKGNA